MPALIVFLNTAAIGLLIYAAARDIMARTVPNWINGSIIIVALPIRVLLGDLRPALFFSMIIFMILALLWKFRLLGGGDVKLWTAATLLLHPSWDSEYFAFNSIVLFGGALALIYLTLPHLLKLKKTPLLYCRSQNLWKRSIRSELWRMKRGGPLPYALAISVGILITLWPTL